MEKAYDLSLQARHLQRRATAEDYLNARELLRRATVRDPKFALAYVALSANYAMMAVDGLERPTDAWPLTNKYARQAVDLNPSLKEARVVTHATATFFDWDWEGGLERGRCFCESPPVMWTPSTCAHSQPSVGRWAGPTKPFSWRAGCESWILSSNLSMLEADYLGHAGQLDAAVDLYQKAIQSDPEDPNSYFGLSEVLYKQKRFDEAIEARRRAHALAGDEELKEVLATARGEDGYREIERARVRLRARSDESPGSRELCVAVGVRAHLRAVGREGTGLPSSKRHSSTDRRASCS